MFNGVRKPLANAISFSGPPLNDQFKCIVSMVESYLPEFPDFIEGTDIAVEDGLNSKLSRFLLLRFRRDGFPYITQPQSMEDETSGRSPSTDIGIYFCLPDSVIDPPKISVIEGKRLDTGIESRRRKEYVYGSVIKEKHKPSGGIERYKKEIHGRNIKSGVILIGYVQTNNFPVWRDRINTWISELVSESNHLPCWVIEELLSEVRSCSEVATLKSIVKRTSGTLKIFHFWINLVGNVDQVTRSGTGNS